MTDPDEPMTLVTKAVFPVAGLGTRFLPATKAQPKEMLPVVDKPLIQYAVEEAYAAGVREMIFVTGRHKRPIEDHFDMTFELEVALEQANKRELLEVVRSVKPDDMECIYVRQAQALGLGHAVLCAQRLIGNDPFAVLLADDLMVGETPVLKQMTEQFAEWQASILAVQEVPAEHTRRYGIVAGTDINDRLVDVTRIVEKPAPEGRAQPLGRGRPLHPDARRAAGDRQPTARRGWRDPAHGRHRRPAAPRKGLRLPLRRPPLRLRQQRRLLGSQRGTGIGAPCAGPGLSGRYLKTLSLRPRQCTRRKGGRPLLVDGASTASAA